MRTLHKFIKENYGLEAWQLLQDWENWVIKDCDYKTIKYLH